MLTGDTKSTAEAVTRGLGIVEGTTCVVKLAISS